MSQPVVVGITGSLRVREGAERAGVNAAYPHSVANAGGIPIILTPLVGSDHTAEIVGRLDALVITGGHDVDPELYQTAPSPGLGSLDRRRDEFEISLFHAARAQHLPILGICRGLQIINVAMGGTLWQDLPSERPGSIGHERSDAARDARVHRVRIEPETRLCQILRTAALTTNSFHHQAIRSLAPGLTASAWAEDGVIEGVEGNSTGDWLIAVQWHPEEFFSQTDASDQRVFPALVDAVRGGVVKQMVR
ncbi:MAG: gamma-glutamyl-gamma-aminobutyrate hydrolase family protein [Gemmatimonadota bacterium]